MTEIMELGICPRKRLNSDESYYILQSKVHVNQKILDLSDPKRMKEIYNKTRELLFRGAKDMNANLEKSYDFMNIFLNGTGNIKYENGIKTLKILKNSNCCNKISYIASDCSNCNLCLCEHCGFSCVNLCGAVLCTTCITLFECGTFDEPICKQCKYLM
ncbi:uncharacterized protein LOC129613567 isoform X1 [Condylostylus longicornis]|uniref:uncharacterized protein LOC129613567 isoform X1 n=1 Tax=Condylostylus longicornis TaxID=2530218 RepID=UPI00244E2B8D|nr:uncharacterized protein LOC129613567 isoform X1 [Condylostylus longicornis]